MTDIEIEELIKKLRQRMKRIGDEKINHIFHRYSGERFEAAKVIEEQAARIADLERSLKAEIRQSEKDDSLWHDNYVALERKLDSARSDALHEVLPVASSLAAAISILENGGKKAVASDRMFEQMMTDYRKSLEDFRATLTSIEEKSDD